MRALRQRRFLFAALPVVVAAGVVALVVALADDEETRPSSVDAPSAEPTPQSSSEADQAEGTDVGGSADEREIVRTAREYVAAVDAGDGAQVCGLLAPGAIGAFELPRRRGGCADSVSASIGYRDPRGFPVFESARIDSIGDVAIGGEQARVTATIVTAFADRDQPSIEDDVVYLVDVGGEWRIAKPSAVLYRAVGKPDVPLEAVAPPG
jgi:hypothetical protein